MVSAQKVTGWFRQAVSCAKSTGGAGRTHTGTTKVSVQPLKLVMINVTSYQAPPKVNVWAGFCRLETLAMPDNGSPKFQSQEMICPPLFSSDRSVNWTSTSSQAPEWVKLATGLGRTITSAV